jgi:hypothetical protein
LSLDHPKRRPSSLPALADDMKGIEIEDRAVAGNDPIYLDNVFMKQMSICPVDYNDDGYTDLTDLAVLLLAYGCSEP